MRRGEAGFWSIELLVVISISAWIGLAGVASIRQTIDVIRKGDDHQMAVSQLQNAGYGISRDAQMAESITTSNLEPTELLKLTWTEWEDIDGDWDDADAVYHLVTYFFEGLSGGVGNLIRRHQTSTGITTDTMVAQRVDYDQSDPVSSSAQYQDQVLSVKLMAVFGDTREVREYRVYRRPNY